MPTKNLIVKPTTSVENALQVFRQFEDLKNSLINPDTDMVQIKGQPYYTKYFWNKMMVVCNLSKEIVSEEEQVSDKGVRIVKVKVRVSAPNGRFSEAIGTTTSSEPWSKGKALSAYIGMATTRATNRCIQDLVAPGSLSAEEIVDSGPDNPEQQSNRPNFTAFFREATSEKEMTVVKQEIVQMFGHPLKDCTQDELDKYLSSLKEDRVIF